MKEGYNALKFNGNHQYLWIDHLSSSLDTNDSFTISFWILDQYFSSSSANAYLETIWVNGVDYPILPSFDLYSDSRYHEDGYTISTLNFITYDSSYTSYSRFGLFTDFEWFKNLPTPIHMAMTRSENNILRTFINGIKKSEDYYPNRLYYNTPAVIGWNRGSGASNQYATFTLDDFCIIKGKALWTQDFTPPTTYLPDKI